jgi:sec-independent protein translocase protein TatB
MLDFGFPELLMIIAVLILVVGPKQIPEIMYNLGRIMRRLSYMRFALSRQFEDFMHDMDVEKTDGKTTDSLNILPGDNKAHDSVAIARAEVESEGEDEEEEEDFITPDPDAEYPAPKPVKKPETKPETSGVDNG